MIVFQRLQTDDSKMTLLETGQLTTDFFGTTFEFFNFVENTLFKVGSNRRLGVRY